MTSSSVIRRALLYVPASSPKFLDKSRALTVDNITYDLEDSVTPAKKPEARANLRSFLEQPRVPSVKENAVRINSVDSGYALEDLQGVLKAPHVDSVVVPKVNSASDLSFVTDVVRHALPERHPSNASTASDSILTAPGEGRKTGPIRLIALIESARALMDLQSICAASPYLSGLIFAAEDFALDLSMTRTPSLSEFLYARSAIVTACRANDLPSAIDLVCTNFRGEEGQRALREECQDGKRLGFNGKQLIHPSQVDVAQSVFSPSVEETEWAVRCMIADAKAEQNGRAAWTLDGKMIDVPVVGKAQGIVAKAENAGFDVAALKERFKHQEPE